MSLLTDSLWVDLTLAISTLILLICIFFNERCKYWKKRGIPYAKPLPILGSFKDNLLGKENIVEVHTRIYNELKGERFGGYFEFHAPNLMIRDPDLIYRVLVKDFAHFHDRAIFQADPDHDPLTNNILGLTGQKWRILRNELSPTFSSGKLKSMIEQIYNSGDHLLSEMDKLAKNKQDVDAHELLEEFTIDVIASCAFGLQFKLDSPEGQMFRKMVLNSFPPSKFATLISLIRMTSTSFSNFLGIKLFSKEVTDYFLKLSKETVRYRKEQGIKRNDFLQLMLDLNENKKASLSGNNDQEEDEVSNQLKFSSVYSKDLHGKKVMTDECLAATSFVFLVAGTNVSSVIAYALYRLATNPHCQDQLHQEIDQVLNKHQTLNSEALKEMVYLDKVLSETLRMFPTGSFLDRICTIPYRIPDSDFVIEKGTRITIPTWAIHWDPEYYPDPEVFNPERFPEPNFKPTPVYLPFGDGPRICIGNRFAVLQMKVCMARMMSQYTISLSKQMKLPLKLEPKGFIPRIQGGIKINVTKRK